MGQALSIGWIGINNHRLNVMEINFRPDIQPGQKQPFTETSSTSLALGFNNDARGVRMAWNNNINLDFKEFPSGNTHPLSETSPATPSLTNFGNSIWIAWTGSGNNNLNFMDFNNPSSKKTFNGSSPATPKETSPVTPAICEFGQLMVAWTGSGNNNLNVMDVNNPSSKKTFGETSPAAPSLAAHGVLA